MKVMLVNQTKKRVIRELRKILYDHPKYRADSENVRNRNSFSERPQRGIIVNGSSADRVRLSADNYVGRLSSFCMLTPYGSKRGSSIEWVRENYPHLESVSPRRDVFPSDPGAYIIDIVSVPDDAKNVAGQFNVTPILTVFDEPLITFQTSLGGSATLSRLGVYPGSIRLWLERRNMLIPNVDYTIDYETSEITFIKDAPPGQAVYADYRYRTPVSGPFQFYRDQENSEAIPGVVIAFGDRCEGCDSHVIVVTNERTDVAEVYGGKFEVSLELVVFSRDNDDKERMSDYVVTKILELQNSLGTEGIELMDVSPGSEGEEVYNQESDEMYYESNVSASFRVDWEVHVPLPIVLIRNSFSSEEEEKTLGVLDGTLSYDLLNPVSSVLDPDYATVIAGRTPTFEKIR